MSQDIPKTYDPRKAELQWYSFWLENELFRGDPDSEGEAFSIVLPPPNVTGSLHMGHALNITLQDILVRWQRMKGRNAVWVPGTDHAGIATQNVVERQLAEEGLHRNDLGREKFEERVWQWKEVSEKKILTQVRRLGCSCDWSRTRFTMDEGLSRAVRQVFVELYREKLIYRGEYLVNWCPRCSTAISDLEVEHSPVRGNLWHLKYPVENSDEYIVVATTRPETMLGDTAVAVHPDDERYIGLQSKHVILPLMDRRLPVIADSFVDREFGTGIVKVTPGHDPNDFEAGRRHELPVIRVIGEDGKMTPQAGAYAGLDRSEARQRVVADLEKAGLVDRVEEHEHNVGSCQRCETIVEPLVSTQWFVRVKPLAEPAIQAVVKGKTRFVPENFARVYFEWMHNIHDWCVSRQLWWGHRIPAWFCDDCSEIIVALDEPDRCQACGSASLRQESDVLDTWFSSALWPFSTLGWPRETRELEVYYPTSTLVTGFDIIFFWVARMMMMGLRFMGEVPFRQVHINGLVRDENGQKMSKSRGNVIDPLELMDEFGADAIRFTLSAMAVPGTDIPFSVSRMAGYRAFCNKIWNAGRFLLLNLETGKPVTSEEIESYRQAGDLTLEDLWILSRLQSLIAEVDRNLESFRFHEASNELYHFFWHELCDWYIELAKPRIGSDDLEVRRLASRVGLYVLERALRLLHPFVPFVTEELWQRLPHEGISVMTSSYPKSRPEWVEPEKTEQMEALQELISSIRTARTENRISPRKQVPCRIHVSRKEGREFLQGQVHHLEELARVGPLEFTDSLPDGGVQIRGVSRLAEFALAIEDLIDVSAERKRLGRQIERIEAEVGNLVNRLSNLDFLEKAPESVVAGVRERHSESLRRLGRLKNQLDGLS